MGLATRRRSSKTAYTSRRMDSINYCRTFHYLNGNSLQLQDRGKTDRPIVKGRRRKERRATLAVTGRTLTGRTLTGRTLTGLLQARHVGQRAATTLQNRQRSRTGMAHRWPVPKMRRDEPRHEEVPTRRCRDVLHLWPERP